MAASSLAENVLHIGAKAEKSSYLGMTVESLLFVDLF
jgi:hypothetical protein